MSGFAWVTLATNDSYSLGALVLANSLKRVRTKYDLAVLITTGVTPAMREKLACVFNVVKEVNVLDSQDEANLALLARPELGITFTKLHCWRLTQYEKCVFIDADALVVRNCDELFEREELSAAPDVGWPDCFNSGVFVYRPSQQTFGSLLSFAASKGSFDGGDQGLLNLFFSDWAHKDISKHLPFIYNMCSTASYSYLPAFKQFGDDVRIIHFIGNSKPWLQYFDSQTSQVHPTSDCNHLQPLLQLWWNIFCESVHSQLSPVMGGIAGALAKMTLGQAKSSEQIAYEEHMRKQSWEQGLIDYMGRDSFDNIWKKICTTLSISEEKETDDKEKGKEKTPPKETAKEVEEKTEEKAETKTSEDTKEIQTKDEPILAITSGPRVLSIKESGENRPNVPSKLLKRKSEEEKLDLPNVIPLGFSSGESNYPPEDVPALTKGPSEPSIPIQIAESVLEADIKESVAEDVKPVKEEAVSSVSAMIQESISTSVESPLEPKPSSVAVDTSAPAQPNGSLVEDDKPQEKPAVPSTIPLQSSSSQIETEEKDLTEAGSSKEESSKIVPEKPVRAGKELKIPGTPTVTEATPPTSPPLEGGEAAKKTVKKTSPKKSSSEEKSEAEDGKKPAKKVVKKVAKKSKESPDEEPEQTTSQDKPKKIIKVAKKTKSSQALDADTSVPDTPPPPTTETPVPPKRKVKPTIKSTKKPEEP